MIPVTVPIRVLRATLSIMLLCAGMALAAAEPVHLFDQGLAALAAEDEGALGRVRRDLAQMEDQRYLAILKAAVALARGEPTEARSDLSAFADAGHRQGLEPTMLLRLADLAARSDLSRLAIACWDEVGSRDASSTPAVLMFRAGNTRGA